MNTPLSSADVQTALKDLPGWKIEGDALTKTITFGSFRAAMSFMVRAGFEAEAMNHHPEWTNVYNRLTIRLNTHDAAIPRIDLGLIVQDELLLVDGASNRLISAVTMLLAEERIDLRRSEMRRRRLCTLRCLPGHGDTLDHEGRCVRRPASWNRALPLPRPVEAVLGRKPGWRTLWLFAAE